MRGPPVRGGFGRPSPYDVPYDRYRRLGSSSYEDDIDFEASTRVFMRGALIYKNLFARQVICSVRDSMIFTANVEALSTRLIIFFY